MEMFLGFLIVYRWRTISNGDAWSEGVRKCAYVREEGKVNAGVS